MKRGVSTMAPHLMALLTILLVSLGSVSARPSVDDQIEHQKQCVKLQQKDLGLQVVIMSDNVDWAHHAFIAIFYFFILLYIFVGIAVTSNIFMMAIEVICSKTKYEYRTWEENGVEVKEQSTVMVWSEAVANLTLVSLGTSAPEILLAIIETFDNKFCLGTLGPGTIVGSAAYNLMIITAVCIISVPAHTTRRIVHYRVFITTSVFAIFAYLWMWFVIQIHSRGRVDEWEAVLTLLFFPILVVVAWLAEKNCFKKPTVLDDFSVHEVKEPSLTSEERKEPIFHFYDEWDDLLDEEGKLRPATVKILYDKLKQMADLTDEEIAIILATKLIQYRGHSYLWYRIRALKALVAGQKTYPAVSDKLKEVMDVLNDLTREETGIRGDLRPIVITNEILGKKAIIEFTATCMAVPSSVGHFTVVVRRTGTEDNTVICKIVSMDGSAKVNQAYLPISKEFAFEPYVMEQKILVHIKGDKHTNRDSNFFLRLYLAKNANHEAKVDLGPMSVMEIVYMDIEGPGEVVFEKKGQVDTGGKSEVELNVERRNGAEGLIRVKYKVLPGPNCTRVDALSGELEFEHGEMKKVLVIPLKPQTIDWDARKREWEEAKANKKKWDPRTLEEPKEGDEEQFDVRFTKMVKTAGSVGDNPQVTVAVTPDPNYKLQVLRLIAMSEEVAAKQCTIVRQTYKEQICSAYIVNGDKREAKRASKMDVFLHWLCLPWKMVLCFLPTPYALGGYPCFIVTLLVLGLLTALAGDFATLFGHLIGLPKVITGLTLVAIGTSLPDTFASRIAALRSPTADAAIGNIMGSNSVNVFLGLGLPWTISAFYHLIAMENLEEDNHFARHMLLLTDTLPFIIAIYTCCAFLVQVVLCLRRYYLPYGFAELGGPVGTKWLTGILLIFCWVGYVFLAICQAYDVKGPKEVSDFLQKVHFPHYNTHKDYPTYFRYAFGIDVRKTRVPGGQNG